MRITDRWPQQGFPLLGLLLGQYASVLHAEQALSDAKSPFATCAAYYFMATNAKPMKEYDLLYRAGEDALNVATLRDGHATAERDLETAAGLMMKSINRDYLKTELLDKQYSIPCHDLLQREQDEHPEHFAE